MNTLKRLFDLFAVAFVFCGPVRAAEVTSELRATVAKIYGAESSSPSDADTIACLRTGRGSREWNRLTAPVVRNLLDPQVSSEDRVKSTMASLPEMRAVVMKMVTDARLVSDRGIQSTLMDLADVHRDLLDTYTRLALPISAGETGELAELTAKLRGLGEKKAALGNPIAQRLRDQLESEQYEDALNHSVAESTAGVPATPLPPSKTVKKGELLVSPFGTQTRSQYVIELQQLAETGDANSQYFLGVAYKDGNGVGQDLLEAVRWLSKAADKGMTKAQHEAGEIYESGALGSTNSIESQRLFSLAAEQGFAASQKKIAATNKKEGNMEAAARWYQKSAVQGDAESQYELGMLYVSGTGVPRDIVLGHHWLNIAGAKGKEAGRNAAVKLEREMTPEQKSESTKMTRDFYNLQGKK
jgi:TPR repeat protein